MKAIKKWELGGVVFLLICLISMYLALNFVVHRGVEAFGTKITGTGLKLEKVRIALLRGHAEIWGMVILNPEQFKTPYAVACRRIKIDFDPESLCTSSILVKEIVIEDPEVMYEGIGSGSNIDMLKKNIESFNSGKQASERESDVKILVERLLIGSGQIHLVTSLMSGTGMTIPLPEIEMKEVGKQNKGEDALTYITRVVFNNLSGTIFAAVSSGDKLIKGAAEVFGDVLSKGVQGSSETVETLKQAGTKSTKKVMESIGTIFKGVRQPND